MAHEPLESTARARLQHDRLEIALTLSGPFAASLVRTHDPETEPGRGGDDLPARLQQLAPGLLAVTAGTQPLRPDRIVVRRNQEAEPEVIFLFPQPGASPLRIEAAYLRRLPARHFSALEILDDAEQALARHVLVAENPAAEIALPGARVPNVTVPTDSESGFAIGRVALASGSAALALAALLGFVRKRRSQE